MPCTRSCCTSASRLSDNCAPRLTTLIAVVATASQMVHYGGQYIDHGTTDISDTSGISDGGGPFLLYACITFAVVWLIIVAMLRYRKMKVYLMGAPTGNATGQFAGQRPLNLDHASRSLSARPRAVLVHFLHAALVRTKPWPAPRDCRLHQGSRTRWSSRSSYEAPRIPRHLRRQSCPASWGALSVSRSSASGPQQKWVATKSRTRSHGRR